MADQEHVYDERDRQDELVAGLEQAVDLWHKVQERRSMTEPFFIEPTDIEPITQKQFLRNIENARRMVKSFGSYDGHYEIFGKCQYGVLTIYGDPPIEQDVAACGEAACYRVWWGDDKSDSLLLCQEHFEQVEREEEAVGTIVPTEKKIPPFDPIPDKNLIL